MTSRCGITRKMRNLCVLIHFNVLIRWIVLGGAQVGILELWQMKGRYWWSDVTWRHTCINDVTLWNYRKYAKSLYFHDIYYIKWNFRMNFECWQEVCGLKLAFNSSGNSGLSHPVIRFSRANSVFIGILPDEYRMLSRKPDKRMWQSGISGHPLIPLIYKFLTEMQKNGFELYFLFSFTRTTVSSTWWVFNTGKGVWSLVLIFLHQAKTLCAQNISGHCIADEICQLKFFWGG